MKNHVKIPKNLPYTNFDYSSLEFLGGSGSNLDPILPIHA